MEDSNENGSPRSYFGTLQEEVKLGSQCPQKDIKATDFFRGHQPPSRNTDMANFKKSLIAIFVAIAAIARAAPIGLFSCSLSFHSLTSGTDKDKGARRPRSPGLFSRQPPSGSRLPTSHIPTIQPPVGLSAISPGAPSNPPVQRHDPEPEDEDDFDVRSVVSEVASEVGSAVQHVGSDIRPILSGAGSVVQPGERGTILCHDVACEVGYACLY